MLAPDLEVLAPIRDAEHPAREGDRARRRVGHPDRERRHDLLGRREPLGSHRRVRPARGSVGRAARGRVRADGAPPEARPSEPAEITVTFDRGVPVALDGEAVALPELIRRARRAGRLLRVRPGRHDREPARGHQEPRALRGAGRARDHPGAPGARGPHARARPRAPQAAARAALGRPRLRRPVVLARCAPRSTPTSTRPRRT